MVNRSTITPVKVAVGLSGGVDSALSAALLCEAGYDIVAVHMRRWDEDTPGCSGSEDRRDALLVAKQLGIPFRVVDFRDLYYTKVVERFLDEFANGRTPNPDVWCNEFIKFGAFLEYATKEIGAEAIATGHYARINSSPPDNIYQLHRGVDESKDQSYFLYRLSQAQLAKAIFPLGKYKKEDVRQFARARGLVTADKPDSVGICFIGDIDVAGFVKQHIDIAPGEVFDLSGNRIGYHQGVQLYTIGQRHGFTLETYQGMPLYVVGKDVKNNRLIVGRGSDSAVGSFEVSQLHWIAGGVPVELIQAGLTVRIRHLGELVPCLTKPAQLSTGRITCRLSKRVRGVALGQHAVFYFGTAVVGGGVIDKVVVDG